MKLLRLEFSPAVRSWLLFLMYAAELTASLWLAYELRFDFMLSPESQHERMFVLLWLIPLQLVALGLFHQFRSLLGYFSTPDLAKMFHALAICLVITLVVWGFTGPGYAPPRGVILIQFVFSLVGLTGVRLALRSLRESLTSSQQKSKHGRRRVAIIGAGDAGAVLAHELFLKPGYGLEPAAFFDDDKQKWNSRIHDIPVLGPAEKLLQEYKNLEVVEAIIAMPSAPAKRVGEIVRMLRKVHIQCKTVPSLDQLALGQVRVSQLRNIEVQDLLGRERVQLEIENISQVLQGKVVMVTGAGGSIGSELCRQIATYKPKRLLLVERSEPQLFAIEQELINQGHAERLVPLIADIQDLPRLKEVFNRFRPQVIFHAAAHKHVPMMEHQPGEAIKNNSLGTAQLADLALEYGVERFTLISSDKAINSANAMGATKRLAEMYIQALFAANPTATKFMAVRFGNVLGSSGSVIPLFQKQIAEGGPVRVTHPDMTRYFMTIPEASMLVLQSAAQGQGGEIFVLDMGKPVRIVDLARQMIELSGLKPDEDIQIEFVGIRPGEKLFEEISHEGEDFAPTNHSKIFRFISEPEELSQVRQNLERLRSRLHQADTDELKRLLQEVVPDYTPSTRPKPKPASRPPSPQVSEAPAPVLP